MKKRIINILLVICITFLIGCASTVKMQKINPGKPVRIGVVVGHEIRVDEDLGLGRTIFFGALGGAVGSMIAAANTEKASISLEDNIAYMIWQKIEENLKKKNYEAELLVSKYKEFKLFENFNNTKKVFPRLSEYYELGNRAKEYDVILFIEALIVGRFKKDQDPENVKLADMRMKYGKSKIFLYATHTHKRFYFKDIQKGYPEWSKQRINEVISTIVNLDAIPEQSY